MPNCASLSMLNLTNVRTRTEREETLMVYGYCRISTSKQNIERQARNIKAVNSSAVIVKETYTGTKLDRAEWNKLYKRVKQGDTIIFDSVSRMSRNAAEGFTAYEALYNRGVDLVFIKEPHINTALFKRTLEGLLTMTNTDIDLILKGVNSYLLAIACNQIQLAFEQSEKEVKDLQQRTKEGLETARLNGKELGRTKGDKLTTKKSIKAKEAMRIHAKAFGGTLTDLECMKLVGISRVTYYKYKSEIKQELEERSS